MKISKFLAVAILGLSIVSCGQQVKTVSSLETELDSVSYAMGLNMANQFKNNFSEVKKEVFFQGLTNGLDSTNLLLEDKDIRNTLNTYFQKQQQEKMKEQQAKAAEKAEKEFGEYKKENAAFLEANKNKAGVKTTESGLQYIVIKEGSGESPKATDGVSVHYKGTNIEGVEFDSSYKRNKPYELKANQFVPGFSEGLQLMKTGAKYKFFIPQELAYKAQARGKDIKPFSTLIFEVELLEVK
ncbi:FKBP-type peptidyl-prolyl cis-trans isomerase [Tenacibaculum aquimarinum]|uniref:FKBP-type peptidyl-prolyl cis-trans isomerase n=1 Tax=Tenacibaculum aquimarinum TaxID=2910675 RepID=UPI001F0ACB0B|nr:FKBP-type peptidyl-prolyl cis-trans isomerase [Tenacibaculum aquimarinum]MCH3885371.1 FKBP-type peptidyl-prolyl cis-trans isomerase [Tenacibaculum aquimarinum]